MRYIKISGVIVGIMIFFIISLIFTDRVVLMWIEHANLLPSEEWIKEYYVLNRNNVTKIDHSSPILKTRGHEVVEKKTKSKRIMVIGDSFVWGDGVVNLNDIWWRQLQFELYRRGYFDIEVIAMGRAGAATWQQYNWAKQYIPAYMPDLVIWGYVTNDPDERKGGHGGVDRRLVPRSDQKISHNDIVSNDVFLRIFEKLKTVFPRIFTHASNYRARKLREVYYNNEEVGYSYRRWKIKLLEGENFKQYEATIHRISMMIKDAGIPSFFITCPITVDEVDDYLPLYKPVAEICAKYGIGFYDIYPELFAKFSKGKIKRSSLGLNPVNGHPGKTLTYFYAVQALNIIEKHYPKILPEKGVARYDLIPKCNDWAPITMFLENHLDFIKIDYPMSNEKLLRMPFNLNRPYVQLCLQQPLEIERITIRGEQVKSVSLFVVFDALEDNLEYDMGTYRGQETVWDIEQLETKLPISSIKIIAEFSSPNRELEIKFDPKK